MGDEVYSRPRDLRIGTFAEYNAIDEDDVAHKPTTLSMPEASAVPLVSLAAWQISSKRPESGPDPRCWSTAAPVASGPP
ncbi:hypothetical protein [Streptomyces griseus]|uniref:hypothetical protein n=1 Tax=Streptomyces griseus TaxID=1911 RepID=UPI003665A6AA